jgi:hypothetical protein
MFAPLTVFRLAYTPLYRLLLPPIRAVALSGRTSDTIFALTMSAPFIPESNSPLLTVLPERSSAAYLPLSLIATTSGYQPSVEDARLTFNFSETGLVAVLPPVWEFRYAIASVTVLKPFAGALTAFTVKLTLKLFDVIFEPLTVTVAVYVPADCPVFGVTVKLLLPFTPMLFIAVIESVNAVLLDNSSVKLPVGWLPVLLTVTLFADCAP